MTKGSSPLPPPPPSFCWCSFVIGCCDGWGGSKKSSSPNRNCCCSTRWDRDLKIVRRLHQISSSSSSSSKQRGRAGDYTMLMLHLLASPRFVSFGDLMLLLVGAGAGAGAYSRCSIEPAGREGISRTRWLLWQWQWQRQLTAAGESHSGEYFILITSLTLKWASSSPPPPSTKSTSTTVLHILPYSHRHHSELLLLLLGRAATRLSSTLLDGREYAGIYLFVFIYFLKRIYSTLARRPHPLATAAAAASTSAVQCQTTQIQFVSSAENIKWFQRIYYFYLLSLSLALRCCCCCCPAGPSLL